MRQAKTYRYAIWNGAHAKPVPAPRRVARAAAARCSIGWLAPPTALVGEHDFVAFKGRGSDVMTTVRRVLVRGARRRRTSTPISRSRCRRSLDYAGLARPHGRRLTPVSFRDLRQRVPASHGAHHRRNARRHRAREHGRRRHARDYRIEGSLADRPDRSGSRTRALEGSLTKVHHDGSSRRFAS